MRADGGAKGGLDIGNADLCQDPGQHGEHG